MKPQGVQEARRCSCRFDPETGLFEPCEAHEQEYVEYLEKQAEARKAARDPHE